MSKPLHILRTEADYEEAVAEFEGFFDHEPGPGTEQGDRFELLGLLIAKYEEDQRPAIRAEPRDVLKVVMEGAGHSQSDLAALLGSRSRASEVLAGKRELTLEQIRLLSRQWRIPADLLIGQTINA